MLVKSAAVSSTRQACCHEGTPGPSKAHLANLLLQRLALLHRLPLLLPLPGSEPLLGGAVLQPGCCQLRGHHCGVKLLSTGAGSAARQRQLGRTDGGSDAAAHPPSAALQGLRLGSGLDMLPQCYFLQLLPGVRRWLLCRTCGLRRGRRGSSSARKQHVQFLICTLEAPPLAAGRRRRGAATSATPAAPLHCSC